MIIIDTLDKSFQSLENQIRILKSKGLVIHNPTVAKKWLNQCNYYNLINGYRIFLDYQRINHDPLHEEKFKPHTTIEELKALYEFDRALRILTLAYILIIEKRFKSNIAYYFEQFHNTPNAYLDAHNYSVLRVASVKKTIHILEAQYKHTINTKESPKHYVKTRGYVPLWIFINSISFGTASKLYKNLNTNEKKLISLNFANICDSADLAAFMEFLTNIRNICAHDERLFSYICFVTPPDLPLAQYFHLSIKSKKSYFGVMIVLKRFLSHQEFLSYYKQYNYLLTELSLNLHTIGIAKVLRKMGFPRNWKKIIHI